MNKRVIWIGELFLWLIIATIISVSFVFIRSYYEQKINSYYLFFNDVDGLMKGSPVKLMGLQVGYVQDIRVFDDSVFVSFLVTKSNVKMPTNASASVAFYGLGGSKSLEIVPATSDNSSENKKNSESIIITKEPYRIQDFYDVQNGMAKMLVKMSNSITSLVEENEIYKTRTKLKMSSTLKGVNTKVEETINGEKKFFDVENKITNRNASNNKQIRSDEEGHNASTKTFRE